MKSNHRIHHKELLNRYGKNAFKVKKDKSSQKDKYMDKVIETLDIPLDVVNGAEIITLVGRRSIGIENYQKIYECEPDRIQVKTKRNYVCIEGKNLKVEYMYEDEVRITGYIHSVRYEKVEV